jgi:hypothetical protein
MKRHHDIRNLTFEGDSMRLTIDGQEMKFELSSVSTVLLKASDQERNLFEISPSGYGIHWPLLDEDISMDGLLGVVHAPERLRKSA